MCSWSLPRTPTITSRPTGPTPYSMSINSTRIDELPARATDAVHVVMVALR